MPNELLPWHRKQWRQLTAYVDNGRIPHALLISGKAGVGKRRLAMRFAQSLLCEQHDEQMPGCGRCSGCQLFQAHTHPDFIRIEPKEPGKPITIDAIRELSDLLALTAQYGGYRIVLLMPAHRLNAAAANGLLKTLEEPVDQTVLLLLTDSPSSLPATILSRCQQLTVGIPDKHDALEWLRQQKVDEQPDALLALAGGAPLLALALARENSLAVRASSFQAWLNVSRQVSDPVSVAELWCKQPCDRVLLWITGWVMDMIRLHHGSSVAGLYNPDWSASLQAEAQKLNLKELFRFLDLLFTSARSVNTQVNKQMLLEEILIEWRRLPRTP